VKFLAPFLLLCSIAIAVADEPLSVLIIDGRNNHDWATTTDAIRATLESSGRFEVTVETAPELKAHRGPRAPQKEDPNFPAAAERFRAATQPAKDAHGEIWKAWNPDFSSYDIVLLNYNGPDWPEPMREGFVDYVRQGGGTVLVHAANNAFGNWQEFNEMIGLGWRKAGFGRAIKIDPDSGEQIWDKEAGNSGHGSKHAFQVTVRQPEHPIMQGIPKTWLHGQDELYHHMRGPAQNLTVLSSAFSDPAQRGTGQHEPITWEVGFGEGRVIVTSMGHFWPGQDNWDGLHCVGFQTILARSCEYAATGSTTIPVPTDFPSEDETSVASPNRAAAGFVPTPKDGDPYRMISPEEELATFDIAPGFEVDLVAAEPDVVEPVLTVWDGNGAMYVAEMRSYMQDEKGTGTKTLKNGRIRRLEDTDGDGRMDVSTVFVDGLNLPRAIMPLDDRIAVRETDSTKVIAYRDTNGDGVADESEVIFEGKAEGRNAPGKSVEHQDSGLHWNLDNWIYLSYNEERHRYTNGEWITEKQPSHWTQWGLDHDDTGRLFWSTNTQPLLAVQTHPIYWNTVRRLATKGISGVPVDLGPDYDADFMKVRSLCLLNDRGGPAAEVRAFTSACGQSVFRGHKFPWGHRGDHFIVDPTIHVVRRSNIVDRDGKIMLEKADPGDAEFLRSSDINCRFVNTATGPDGCLYVTDMYRGIIQDAGWLSPGPREAIVKNGLHDNNQRGRIWRVRHRDHKPGSRPRMLDETTIELLRHLEHPNGWWRDTAQRLIILRENRDSVVPLLGDIVRYTQNPLARLHALWTLEGIGAIDRQLLQASFLDRDPRIRAATIKIAEQLLEEPGMVSELADLAVDPDPEVAKQAILTLGMTTDEPYAIESIQVAARRHLDHQGVMLATAISLWGMKDLPFVKEVETGSIFKETANAANWKAALGNWNRGLSFPDDMPDAHQRLIKSGEVLFFKHCTTCHGPTGKGIQIIGTDQFLAPPLTGSPRVQGDPEQLVPILLHGLMGPLDGKTYQAGFMAPAIALGITRDDRLAELLSYIRYAWDQELPVVTKEQVEAIRRKHADRKLPWTQAELEAIEP
jgi:putative membrane-bound dehydrogenase-like protein